MSEPELLVDVLARVLTHEPQLHVRIDLWAFEQWGAWFCASCSEALDECDCHTRSDA